MLTHVRLVALLKFHRWKDFLKGFAFLEAPANLNSERTSENVFYKRPFLQFCFQLLIIVIACAMNFPFALRASYQVLFYRSTTFIGITLHISCRFLY